MEKGSVNSGQRYSCVACTAAIAPRLACSGRAENPILCRKLLRPRLVQSRYRLKVREHEVCLLQCPCRQSTSHGYNIKKIKNKNKSTKCGEMRLVEIMPGSVSLSATYAIVSVTTESPL